MKAKVLLKVALCGLLTAACSVRPSGLALTFSSSPVTVRGFHAPWHGLPDDDTRLTYYATEDSLFFRYEVSESSLCLTPGFQTETDVNPEDRVELFFSATPDMSQPYYCTEIDPCGRSMDYKAVYYRDIDYGWDFSGTRVSSKTEEGSYTVEAVFSRKELEVLGLDLEQGFWLGAFRADFRTDGAVDWYSLRPTDDREADFHKPDILIPCRVRP